MITGTYIGMDVATYKGKTAIKPHREGHKMKTYWKGFEIKLTGKIETFYGADFEEFEILEGPEKGKIRYRPLQK